MTRSEKCVLALTGGLVLFLWITEGIGLWEKGPLGAVLVDSLTRNMVAELCLVFFWNLWFLGRLNRPVCRTLGLGAGIFVFSWAHRIFVPLAVSGLYAGILLLAGRRVGDMLGMPLKKKKGEQAGGFFLAERLGIWLILGCSLWIVLVCAVSLSGRGGVWLWRGLGALLGLTALVWEMAQMASRARKEEKKLGTVIGEEARSLWEGWNVWLPQNRLQAVLGAFVLTMLMLQLGRLNIELDYDSLHYGLRSSYVLDNGMGIYENLGMVNLVYTYPKGLEILALPLSGTPTYGFVLCLSFWAAAAILFFTGHMAGRMGGRNRGYWASALTAAVPGIMNMAATAKSDSATLLFQLLLLDFASCAVAGTGPSGARPWPDQEQGDRTPWLFWGGAAWVFTLVLKPTAVVFSTILAFMGLMAMIFCGRPSPGKGLREIRWVLLPAAATAGVWYRTYGMTGVPATSIFAGVFEKLGFQVSWPFNFTHVIGDSSVLGLGEKIQRLVRRLIQMGFLPRGEDMAHVIIAWGSGLITLMTVWWLIWLAVFFWKTGLKKARSQGQNQEILAVFLLPALGLACLISIYQLSQVDGNYFELFYAGIIVFTAGLLGRHRKTKALEKNIGAMLVPLLILNVLLTCCSGWGGQLGFTPISWKHRGYYDHRAQAIQTAGQKGVLELTAGLNPRSRVVAFGTHPDVLSLPCCVQSYYDITGSGGNVVLVKKLDYFKEFLAYAQTEYIYVEAGYLGEQERARELIQYMIEDGSLTDLAYGGGCLLGRVDLTAEAPSAQEAERLLWEFAENYQMKTEDR